MIIKQKDTSKNFDNNKEYKRSSYWCKNNDVWAVLEIPK